MRATAVKANSARQRDEHFSLQSLVTRPVADLSVPGLVMTVTVLMVAEKPSLGQSIAHHISGGKVSATERILTAYFRDKVEQFQCKAHGWNTQELQSHA